MSATNIRALKNRHEGEMIFVVASGHSVDFLRHDVFGADVVVAVNEMFRHVPATYAVMHHHEHAQEAIDAGVQVVVSARDWGAPGWGAPAAFHGDYFVYETAESVRTLTPTIDEAALREDTTDGLVVSACTTSEALQFAGHLGAGTILCCGIDGAALDGQWCVTGYNGGAQTNPQHVRLTWPIVHVTIEALRAKGIRVYGLSPFVGADHEGHIYTPAPVLERRELAAALRTINWQQPAGAR
jgi:hypothetical protein